MNKFTDFLKGIRLKPTDSGPNPAGADPTDNIEGSMWVYANKIKAYINSAIRVFVTEDETQTLTNKTIDADNNTISNLEHGAEVDNPSSGVHGVTGDVVGSSDIQTLTNKTIDGDDNTVQDLALGSLKTVLGDASKFIERDGSGVVISGKSVPSGDVIGTSDIQTLTNKTIDADNNTISNLEHGAEVDNPSSGVHGVVGSVVGTSDGQTLTNKTIDADNNTISNLAHGAEVDNPSSGVHGVVGTIVGTSDAQILTSKTIDADNNTISNLEHGAEVDNPSSGVHGVTGNVVGTSDIQTLTNKTLTSPDINGGTLDNADVNLGTASDSQKIVVSSNTKSNLDGLTREAASLYYASDLKKFFGDDGTSLQEIGSSAGDADTIHLIKADDLASTTDIDLKGNNADFDGGGAIVGTLSLSTTAADLIIDSTQVIKYVATTSAQNDYFGFTKSIPIGQRGRTIGIQFNYKNDSTTNDDDFRFCFKIKDGARAGTIEYANLTAFNNSNNTGTVFSGGFYVPEDCTEIEFGWQNTDSTTTIQLLVDNILISQSPWIYKDYLNTTEWEDYTPTGAWTSNTTYSGKWRRIGEEMEVRFRILCTGSPNAATASVSIPSGYTIDSNKLSSNTTNNPLGIADTNSGTYGYQLRVGYLNGTTVRFLTFDNNTGGNFDIENPLSNSSPFSYGSGDYIEGFFSVPIVGWEATTEHVVHAGNGTENQFNAIIPSSGTSPTSQNVDFISSISWSSNVCTITLDSNIFDQTPSYQVTALYNGGATDDFRHAQVNSISTSQIVVKTGYATNAVALPFSLELRNQSSDYKNPSAFAITPVEKIAYVKDLKSVSTSGGSITADTWTTRVLNTVEGDSSIVSLSSNQFTLDRGEYVIKAIAPGYNCGTFTAILYNTTDSSIESEGTIEKSSTTTTTHSTIEHRMTLSAAKTFEIQQQCETTSATDGLGYGADVLNDAAYSRSNNVYTIVEIRKLK
jgi:hypothetical protein